LHIESMSLTSTPVPSQITPKMNAGICLVEAVDEVLEMVGEQVRPLVYGYLENRFRLAKDQIPARPGVFLTAISSLFGAASKSLEQNIVKRFYAKMRFPTGSTENLSLRTMYLQLQQRSTESKSHVRWI